MQPAERDDPQLTGPPPLNRPRSADKRYILPRPRSVQRPKTAGTWVYDTSGGERSSFSNSSFSNNSDALYLVLLGQFSLRYLM